MRNPESQVGGVLIELTLSLTLVLALWIGGFQLLFSAFYATAAGQIASTTAWLGSVKKPDDGHAEPPSLHDLHVGDNPYLRNWLQSLDGECSGIDPASRRAINLGLGLAHKVLPEHRTVQSFTPEDWQNGAPPPVRQFYIVPEHTALQCSSGTPQRTVRYRVCIGMPQWFWTEEICRVSEMVRL